MKNKRKENQNLIIDMIKDQNLSREEKLSIISNALVIFYLSNTSVPSKEEFLLETSSCFDHYYKRYTESSQDELSSLCQEKE